MDAFSDALLDLCAPHLGWAIEQFDVFCSVLPEGAVWIDAGTGVARVGDLELRADLLGTYAEDATFQWAWAKRVALSHDGTVNHATYGLQGTLA